jgi:hypothetical protein
MQNPVYSINRVFRFEYQVNLTSPQTPNSDDFENSASEQSWGAYGAFIPLLGNAILLHHSRANPKKTGFFR